MIVYSYMTGLDDGPSYFATLKEAKADAQQMADFDEEPIEIVQHVIAKLPTRNLAVALLSNHGWSSQSEIVHTVRPKGRR